MRDAWRWWRGVAVLVLAPAAGCLSLSTGDGGQGGTGGVGGTGGLDGVPGGAGAGGTGGDESGAVTASSSTGGASTGSGAGGYEDGHPCTGAADCLSGFCADGVCCDVACDVACVSCARPSSIGTCTLLPAQEEDPGTCTITSACDGAGVCKLKNGQPCTVNGDCLSNKCIGSGANKTCTP